MRIAIGKIFVWMSVLMSLHAFARIYAHIKDPKNLLQKMDAFVGHPPFEKAFKCGRTLVYEINTCARFCEPFICSEVCDPAVKEYKIQLRDCDKQSVAVFNVSSNKEWFKITPKTYEAHSFVRFFLAAPWIGKPDKSSIGEEIGKNFIELTDLKKEKFALRNKQEIEAIRLYYTYFYFDERLKKHVPSAQSILVPRYEETAGLHLDHTFYEVKKPIAKVVEIIDP